MNQQGWGSGHPYGPPRYSLTNRFGLKAKLSGMEQRIAAACVQMDSWHLLAINVAHLITQGVQDFFIMNHYCKSDFRGNLENIFGQQARFRWFTKSTQPFYQSAMTTFLAHEAKREGFEALVVFDADEFFTAKDVDKTLAEAISAEMGRYSHLKVEVQNFMVEGVNRTFGLKSLGEAQPNPKPKVTPQIDTPLFRWVPRLSLRRMGKVVVNLNKLRAKDFVPTGNHYGSGLGKKSKQISLLHLPFWSRDAINQRVEHHQNLNSTPDTSGVGVHLGQIAEADPDAFWTSRTWSRDPATLSGKFVQHPQATEFSLIREKILFRFPVLEESEKLFHKPVQALSIAPDLSTELDKNGPRLLYLDGKTVSAQIARFLRIIARIEVNLGLGKGG
jgi:hypothetical protein